MRRKQFATVEDLVSDIQGGHSVWGKVKGVLATVGGILALILAVIFGGRRRETVPDNRERADGIRDDIDSAGADNQSALDAVRRAANRNNESIRDAQSAADDNRAAADIIRRVRERGGAQPD